MPTSKLPVAVTTVGLPGHAGFPLSQAFTVKLVVPAGVELDVVIVSVEVMDEGVPPVKVTFGGLRIAVAPAGSSVVMLRLTSRPPLPVRLTVTT